MRGLRQALLFGVCVLGGPALAAAPQACPTWFPDFGCERHGRYEGFTAPMTMPYLFEDPFITTGVYAYGVWHDLPENGVFQGGDARVFAVQARLAITDRLGFIATQDGLTWLRPDNDLLDSERGVMDMIAGLKYALVDRREDRLLLSASLRYKTDSGTRDILQGYGDGGWIPGLSLAWGTDAAHVIADVGAYYPIDGTAESSFGFWNVHVGVPMSPRLVPFAALNWIRYLDDGGGANRIKLGNGARLSVSTVQSALGLGAFEAIDYGNLGSNDIENTDYITWGIGLRYALAPRVSLGACYERPLTTTREITKQRATLSLAFEL